VILPPDGKRTCRTKEKKKGGKFVFRAKNPLKSCKGKGTDPANGGGQMPGTHRTRGEGKIHFRPFRGGRNPSKTPSRFTNKQRSSNAVGGACAKAPNSGKKTAPWSWAREEKKNSQENGFPKGDFHINVLGK